MTASAERVSGARVSVVVPTYNDVGRIGDALDSIVTQTAPPAEIVVADDASQDNIAEFVERFADSRARGVPIRYVRLERNSGDAAARNAGIQAARGELIAICDSDDFWAPTKLQRQLELMRDWSGSRRIALLGSHGHNVNDAKRVISPAVMGPTSEDAYEAVRRRGGLFFVIHSSVLFSRADYDAVGGYSTVEYGAANEFEMFCRLGELGVVMNLPEPLVYYRKRAGSMQLDLFWDRHYNVMRLAENQRRRARGERPVSREEFDAQEASASPWLRLKRRRHVWGMYYYRAGATHLVNGSRARGGVELALASLLDSTRLRRGVSGALRSRGRRRTPAQELPIT
jgi:glycosyltransferase involved in cell wall biosynthesis